MKFKRVNVVIKLGINEGLSGNESTCQGEFEVVSNDYGENKVPFFILEEAAFFITRECARLSGLGFEAQVEVITKKLYSIKPTEAKKSIDFDDL